MSDNQEAFQKAMNLGHSAAWDQMWDQAAAYYRQALEEISDHPTALTNLGLALFEMKNYEDALRIYQRSTTVSPQDPVSFEKIGKITERMGQLAEAVLAYTQAADLYLKGRDVDKSIHNWMQVLRLQESLLARSRLALIYDRVGRKPEAAVEYMAVASLMQRAGDMTKALQAAEYALKLMPDSSDAQQIVIMLRNNQPLPRPSRPRGGTGPTRMAEVRQLETNAGSSDADQDPISEARQTALIQLAGLLFDQNEVSNPEGQISRQGIKSMTSGTGGDSLANAEHTRIMLHLSQAIDSLTKGENDHAIEELDRSIEAGLQHPGALFGLGLLVYQKNPQKAMRCFQGSVKHPDYALATYLLIGQINYDAGDMLDAVVAYLQALRLADAETLSGDAAVELRQLYEPIIEAQSRQTDQTVLKSLCESIHNQLVRQDWRSYLKLARQQLPPQPEGVPALPLAEMMFATQSGQVVEMLTQIRSLAKQNKLISAMEETYHALQYAPTYLPLHIQIADLLLQEGHIQPAIDKLMLVAELYALRGETSQAVSLFNRIIEFAPMNLSVRSHLIELLITLGKTDAAVEQYLSLADIYYHLAELDMARQTYTAALKVTQPSRSSRPVMIQILYKIADIDMQRLDLRNAMRIYEQIRTLEPEDIHSRARLVELNFRFGQEAAALNEIDGFLALLENGSKHNLAVEFLKEVVTDEPEKHEVRKRLAELFQRTGRNKDALQQWEILANQALAHTEKPLAITAFQAIIGLNPPDIEEYQKRLAQIQRLD